MSRAERQIAKVIRDAHRNGQSVDDVLTEVDMAHLNTTSESTPDLVARLAAQQGLGR